MRKLFTLLAIFGLIAVTSCKPDKKKEADPEQNKDSTEQVNSTSLDKPGRYNGWDQQILSYLKADRIPESFPEYSGESNSAYKAKCAEWGRAHLDQVKESKREEARNFNVK